jgi:hypothetical protein
MFAPFNRVFECRWRVSQRQSNHVNRRGYLIVEKRKKHQTHPNPLKPRTAVRKIHSVSYQPETPAARKMLGAESEVCWICMGWQEVSQWG